MKKTIFLVLFAMTMVLAFANECETTCDAPNNVVVVSKSSGSISFDWDDCAGGCLEYEVRYVRLSDNYTSSWRTVSSSDYSFTGLYDGGYEFQFRTVCGGGVSGFIVIEDNVWL
ncbi:MAG: fibronectin type III domain-containing protein [Saprospiraceae bacterium]